MISVSPGLPPALPCVERRQRSYCWAWHFAQVSAPTKSSRRVLDLWTGCVGVGDGFELLFGESRSTAMIAPAAVAIKPIHRSAFFIFGYRATRPGRHNDRAFECARPIPESAAVKGFRPR